MAEISRTHGYPFEIILPLYHSLNAAGEEKKTFVAGVTVKENGDTRRNVALDHAITTLAVRRQDQEFDCWSKHVEDEMRFFIGFMRRLHETSVPSVTGAFQLDCETFAAGAVRNCVRIGDFEAAFLQIFAVVEHRAAHKKCALWIDNEANI